MKQIRQAIWVSSVLVVLVSLTLGFALPRAYGQEPAAEVEEDTVSAPRADRSMLALSAAISVSVACLAAGYAVGHVGAAALGAASEKPELLGRSLILVGLAEGIAIYGLIFGIMLLQMM